MSAVVQAYDPNDRAYVAIEVASGNIIARQAQPFRNKVTGELMEEVEPLERIRPQRQAQSDPLDAYR